MRKSNEEIIGRIHSTESGGTVDGPGIRFVVFTQGCALRCLYCHNPDSHSMQGGKEIEVSELMNQVMEYKNYMRFSGGGVTVSGGEPLLQSEFVGKLFALCKENNIHTVLDTSGNVDPEVAQKVLDHTDLVLLDIKAFESELYKRLTAGDLEMPIKMASHLSAIKKPTWIRYVLVPGLTDNLEQINQLAEFVSKLGNVERVEVLPFHKMGEYKWEELNYAYQLSDTPTPSEDLVQKVKEIFQKYELNARS